MALGGALPALLSSVTSSSFHQPLLQPSVIVMDAYTERFKFGTKALTERVYKRNRQVVDKSKTAEVSALDPGGVLNV